jgi:predicted phage gp36 major capsid-like protein
MTTKPPIIRPGQRKPYIKATRQQIDQRRGFVARMLDAGKTKSQIHRAVREKFNVEWRQCDRDISWLTRPRTLAGLKTGEKQADAHDVPVCASASPDEDAYKTLILCDLTPSTKLEDCWKEQST